MPGADRAAHQLGFGHPGSISFAVMPGDDDVVILGNPTLKLLEIDVYDSLGHAHGNARPSPVSTMRRTGSVAESPSSSTLYSNERA